jgi:hypothetical protein
MNAGRRKRWTGPMFEISRGWLDEVRWEVSLSKWDKPMTWAEMPTWMRFFFPDLNPSRKEG